VNGAPLAIAAVIARHVTTSKKKARQLTPPRSLLPSVRPSTGFLDRPLVNLINYRSNYSTLACAWLVSASGEIAIERRARIAAAVMLSLRHRTGFARRHRPALSASHAPGRAGVNGTESNP